MNSCPQWKCGRIFCTNSTIITSFIKDRHRPETGGNYYLLTKNHLAYFFLQNQKYFFFYWAAAAILKMHQKQFIWMLPFWFFFTQATNVLQAQIFFVDQLSGSVRKPVSIILLLNSVPPEKKKFLSEIIFFVCTGLCANFPIGVKKIQRENW